MVITLPGQSVDCLRTAVQGDVEVIETGFPQPVQHGFGESPAGKGRRRGHSPFFGIPDDRIEVRIAKGLAAAQGDERHPGGVKL